MFLIQRFILLLFFKFHYLFGFGEEGGRFVWCFFCFSKGGFLLRFLLIVSFFNFLICLVLGYFFYCFVVLIYLYSFVVF